MRLLYMYMDISTYTYTHIYICIYIYIYVFTLMVYTSHDHYQVTSIPVSFSGIFEVSGTVVSLGA